MWPKMTIAWTLTYFGLQAAGLAHPIYSLCAYLLEYYLRPSLHWWGADLPDLRWNLLVSVGAVIAYALKRSSLPTLPTRANPSVPWLIGLVITMMFVTLTTAVSIQASWDQATLFMKYMVLYGLIVGVVRERWTLDTFLAVHVMGAAWWGWEAYRDPDRSQGRLLNVGSSDTLGDNQASAHLLTVLPFAFVFLLTHEDRRFRLIGLVALPFIVNLFVLCNSRGATVGLVLALGVTWLASSGRLRWRMAGVGVLAALMFAFLADPEFVTRQQSTADYETDNSANARLETWNGALALIADHPLGTGGRGFDLLSPVYIPNIVAAHEGELRTSHNTWLLVAAEWGILGFVLYLGLLGSVFVVLARVRKAPHAEPFFVYRSLALHAGLAGTLAASTFSNRFYGESVYWMCALAIALWRTQERERWLSQGQQPVDDHARQRVPYQAATVGSTVHEDAR